MKGSKIFTIALIVAVATLLVVLAFKVNIGATTDSIVILQTTGMTCGSCSSTITTALGATKGVAVTEVDVNGGWVIVGYETKTIKPEAIAEKITKTGFGSTVYRVLSPEIFKELTGRSIGQNQAGKCGSCSKNGSGCGGNK